MRQCKMCQQYVEQDAFFCPYCGVELDKPNVSPQDESAAVFEKFGTMPPTEPCDEQQIFRRSDPSSAQSDDPFNSNPTVHITDFTAPFLYGDMPSSPSPSPSPNSAEAAVTNRCEQARAVFASKAWLIFSLLFTIGSILMLAAQANSRTNADAVQCVKYSVQLITAVGMWICYGLAKSKHKDFSSKSTSFLRLTLLALSAACIASIIYTVYRNYYVIIDLIDNIARYEEFHDTLMVTLAFRVFYLFMFIALDSTLISFAIQNFRRLGSIDENSAYETKSAVSASKSKKPSSYANGLAAICLFLFGSSMALNRVFFLKIEMLSLLNPYNELVGYLIFAFAFIALSRALSAKHTAARVPRN